MPIATKAVSIIPIFILVELAVTCGCTSLSHKTNSGQSSGSQHDARTSLNNAVGKSNSAATSNSQLNSRAKATSLTQSGEHSIAETVSSMFQRMADAARIKPHVTPAADPIKLATKHTSLGPEVYVTAARLQEKYGNTPKALRLYQKASQVAPNDVGVSIALARHHVGQEHFNDALSVYHNALDKHANDPTLHNDIGICYARMRKLDKAIASYSQALELQPDNSRYRNNLAETLVEVGLVDEAFAQLRKVQHEAVAYYQIGYLLERKGDLRQASLFLGKALAANPQLADARDLMYRVNIRLAEHPQPSGSRRRIRPVVYELSVSDQDGPFDASAQDTQRGTTMAMAAEPPSLLPLDVLPPLPPFPDGAVDIWLGPTPSIGQFGVTPKRVLYGLAH